MVVYNLFEVGLKMGSNLMNNITETIEIEDDVIDLDGDERTAEEIIYEWDARIRKKFAMFAVADNENVLEDLMKEYLTSAKEMARSYEDNETLKNRMFSHIKFLYSYHIELQCYSPDNYLDNMEDILTLYCDLELEVLRSLKTKQEKRIVSVARRVIHMLTVFLLERHDHILHVLIKMNTTKVSDSCSEMLNILYMHFLIKVRVNLSDESFCRTYIVFQKWKEIQRVEDWERMDKFLYKMFKRTPESVKTNETLKQILMPASQSTIDIVLNLFKSSRAISSAYFNHVKSKKTSEIDDLDFNIDLGEDEPSIAVNDENEEEVQFMKTYCEVERSMLNLPHETNTSTEYDIFRKCKEELDDDDDVQFVEITEKQPTFSFGFEDEESQNRVTNNVCNNNPAVEVEEPSILEAPVLSKSVDKLPILENLNGLSRKCVESVVPIVESIEESDEIEPIIPSILSVSSCDAATETNQPEVPFISPPSPSPVCETLTVSKKSVEMKSVEVQADCIYDDYGFTTPPFDVPSDEQTSRTTEAPMYTNINEKKKDECEKRSIEVQVEPNNGVYDYGLTPPNDTHLDDHGTRIQENCLYTNISKDLTENGLCNNETFNDNEDNQTTDNELDDQLDISEMNVEEETVNSNEKDELDQIDTGQEITNSAPNIEPVTAEAELNSHPETYNGVLKNRTNGQTSPPKILYTSSKAASLDDFSRFENHLNRIVENHDFDDIFSGPVDKIVPAKSLIFQNSTSRSSSPTEMTSPAYEAIDDFRNYFSDSVNGRVPPPNDVKVPPGILKKDNKSRGKNHRIAFHESTVDFSEERKRRSDGVLVPKRIRRDRKLNMEPKVVVEKLSFLENKMKKVLNNPPTLRVDYDKTTPHINEKDIVRCISPPKFTWIVNFSNRNNSGSLTVKNREHLEKKPKKRKFEISNSSNGESLMRKRAFRTPKKKPLASTKVKKNDLPSPNKNTFNSKSDSSEFDKLLNSGAYSSKPFRLDLTS